MKKILMCFALSAAAVMVIVPSLASFGLAQRQPTPAPPQATLSYNSQVFLLRNVESTTLPVPAGIVLTDLVVRGDTSNSGGVCFVRVSNSADPFNAFGSIIEAEVPRNRNLEALSLRSGILSQGSLFVHAVSVDTGNRCNGRVFWSGSLQ